MGKNRTVRAGIALMALALITSSFAGTTLAKYTTSNSGSDTARVAKFGVKVEAYGDKTFATAYKGSSEGYTTSDVVSASTIAGTQDKVVAPGTWGQLSQIKITGTPEVAVKISYELTKFELGDNWVDKDGNYYCPLVIHVRNTIEQDENKKTTLDGLSYSSADDFENAVKAEVEKYTQVCVPGTDLTTQNSVNMVIDWAWPFDQTGRQYGFTENPAETVPDVTQETQSNVKDTYLGDQAAEDNPATITLELTTTVTQID